MGFSSDSADKELIRDSSDSNPRFYNVTCAGDSQRGLHIVKWEFRLLCLPFTTLFLESIFQDARIKSSDDYGPLVLLVLIYKQHA